MSSPKILIMVLTFMEPPYDELYRSQISTWDSIPEEDVHTLFYHGGAEEVKADLIRQHHKSTSTLLQTTDTNEYYWMSAKLKTALRYGLMSNPTFIYRTNSSSYINKKRLKEFAATLPTEKLYTGWTMIDSNYDGKECVSGAGILMSRDVAEILKEQIDPLEEREEDILVGRVLRKNGIVAVDDKTRYDVPEIVPEDMPTDRIHYRFKCGASRSIDSANMRIAHQKIISQ